MKKLLLPSLLFCLGLTAQAQQADQIGYYYQGQKIYYPVSYDRIVVGTAPQASFAELQGAIAAALAIPADSITESTPGKQLLIKLGRDRPKADVVPLISAVKGIANVLYARPVFISESENYNSYGTDFIVNLKAATTYAQLQSLMTANGCTLVRKYPFQDDMYILAAGPQVGYDALAMANLFYETGLFDYAEPDNIVYDALHLVPNDPLFSLQWSLSNTGTAAQYNGTPGADMKVPQAWDITMGQPYIKVGVIDEGVDLTHPDLQANVLQGFNGATLTSNPGDGAPLAPARAHGTNCAGIIAAVANNNTGVAGVAPNCKIIPAVMFGATGTSLGDVAIAACFDYCRLQGASVISNSWGGGSFSTTKDSAIYRAVTLGRSGKGCLVLFSSGNGNTAVSYPATTPSVVAVGGVNMCNQRKSPTSCDGETTWGSNYGTSLDVVAPCVKVASTDIQGTGGYNTAAGTAGNYYNTFNGTSSACPNAAGVAALIYSVDSNLTLAQARQILEGSCDKVPGYTYTGTTGQPYSTWNNSVGHGRVNAFAAVQRASTGQFCTVVIGAASTSYCNTPVALSVISPVAGATYEWQRGGVVMGTGTSYNALSAGTYVAVIMQGTCTATSEPIVITPAFSLQVTASPSTVCAGGSTQLTATAGLLSTPSYCQPVYSSGTSGGDYISQATIATTTLNNLTGASASPYYTLFPQAGSTTATLTANTPYTLTVKGGTYGTCLVRGWIDYNRDGTFDATESIGISPNVGASATGTISFTMPGTALNGVTRMRLRSDDNTPGPATTAACATIDYGETEDYFITITGGTPVTFTYAWFSLPGNNTLTSTTGAQVTAANIPAGNTIYFVTATAPGGCIVTASVTVSALPHTWTGIVSSNWNTAGDWNCVAVPPPGASITIPAGTPFQPVLTSAVSIGSLSLASTLSLNNQALTIGGAVTGAGSFIGSPSPGGASTASMTVTGAAGTLKFVSGSRKLYAFTIQPGASATIDGNLQLGP